MHSVIYTDEATGSSEENFIAESITNPNIFVSHQAADHDNSIGQDYIKTEPESHITDDFAFAADNDNTGRVYLNHVLMYFFQVVYIHMDLK